MSVVYFLALVFFLAYVVRFLFLCCRFLYYKLAAEPATGRICALVSSEPDKNHTSGSLLNTYSFRITSSSGVSDSVYLDHIDPGKDPSVTDGDDLQILYNQKSQKYLPVQKARKDISVAASVVLVSFLVILSVLFVSDYLLPRFFDSWSYILHG